MGMRRTFGLWAAIVGTSLLALSCKPPAPKEIRLGAIIALSGPGKAAGEAAREGLDLAVDELNAGDFKATPIRLTLADSASDPDAALAALRKMVEVQKVPAILGLVLSDEVLACAPAANQLKTVILSTNASSNDIRVAGDYVFRNETRSEFRTAALADLLAQRLVGKRIAILHSSSGSAVSASESLTNAMLSRGLKSALNLEFPAGRTNFRAEIERLRGLKPDAVYVTAFDKDSGTFLKQAAEAGFAPQFYAEGLFSQALLDAAGPAAEGLIGPYSIFDAESADPRVKAFVTAYRSRYGKKPHSTAANTYDAVRLLAEQIRGGATTGEQVKEALYGVQDFPGVVGPIRFDSDGEVKRSVRLVQVRDGVYRSLEAAATPPKPTN